MMSTSLSLPRYIPVEPIRVVNKVVHFRSNAPVWIQLPKSHVVCPDEKVQLDSLLLDQCVLDNGEQLNGFQA